MDFGGFILFGLLAVGLLLGGVFLVAAFSSRSPRRWRGLGLWFGGLALLVVLSRYCTRVRVDEGLFIAAAKGDVAEVSILLSDGASPNATWEDGTSALSASATQRSQRRSDHSGTRRRDQVIEFQCAGKDMQSGLALTVCCEWIISHLARDGRSDPLTEYRAKEVSGSVTPVRPSRPSSRPRRATGAC